MGQELPRAQAYGEERVIEVQVSERISGSPTSARSWSAHFRAWRKGQIMGADGMPMSSAADPGDLAGWTEVEPGEGQRAFQSAEDAFREAIVAGRKLFDTLAAEESQKAALVNFEVTRAEKG